MWESHPQLNWIVTTFGHSESRMEVMIWGLTILAKIKVLTNQTLECRPFKSIFMTNVTLKKIENDLTFFYFIFFDQFITIKFKIFHIFLKNFDIILNFNQPLSTLFNITHWNLHLFWRFFFNFLLLFLLFVIFKFWNDKNGAFCFLRNFRQSLIELNISNTL